MDNQALLAKAIQWILKYFTKKGDDPQIQVSIPIDEPKEAIKPDIDSAGINWNDPKSMVSKHFTVAEAITLHAWNRLATEEDGLTQDVKNEIVKLCSVMDEVRDILGCPMNAHCIFRSVKYNQEVLHSLPNDVHAAGKAIDFDCAPHLTIEEAKEKIRPYLEKLNIRMEGATTSWIHLDTHAVGPSGREFKA
jgi:hypothetical protein